MFEKLEKTKYPPKDKSMMVWDGDCGFCKYWIIRWQKVTGTRIEYVPYQQVHELFKDIDVKHFKLAVRLIEPNGKIYNGPEAAYRAYQYGEEKEYLLLMYRKFDWFRDLSDRGYDWIAHNRSLMMKITHKALGKDPYNIKPYWLMYLIGAIIVLRLFKKSGR